jgi:ketosteroid isomerase-like protein
MAAVLATASPAHAADVDLAAARAAIVKADEAFCQAAIDRDLPRFLALVDERATFNGGTEGEAHGREAVGKAWAPFFEPNGPTLTWKPTRAEVLVSGDVGYTSGTWERRVRTKDGQTKVGHGEYFTVWRRQADGSWRAVYDTGGEAP